MEIIKREKNFVVRSTSAYDALAHADLSFIPGRVYNSGTNEWIIPQLQEKAVRAFHYRHQERRYLKRLNSNKPPLRHYQQEGLRFAETHPSILLDMWMGAGKTRLAIELIDFFEARKILILGPTSASSVWRDQLEEYAEFPYQALILDNKKLVRERARYLRESFKDPSFIKNKAIVSLNYEAAWREPLASTILGQTWDMLILDECHRIKKPGGKASRFTSKLAPYVPFRVGLSGTPLPHSILDAYAIYRTLQPSIFGLNYAKFKTTYAVENQFTRGIDSWINEEQFRRKFNSIRYHVPREELRLDAPIISPLPVRLSVSTWKIYKEMEREFMAVLDAERTIDAPNVLVRYLRLQQIESGFLTDENKDVVYLKENTAKPAALADFLLDFPANERLVVFCRFSPEIEQITLAAQSGGRTVFQLTGQKKQLDEWKRTEGAVLAVNLAAGSEAVDMTAASYAVFYSLSPKLSEYEQAIARVNRPGQRRAPYVYIMVAESPDGEKSIGYKILAALKARRNVLDYLIGDK